MKNYAGIKLVSLSLLSLQYRLAMANLLGFIWEICCDYWHWHCCCSNSSAKLNNLLIIFFSSMHYNMAAKFSSLNPLIGRISNRRIHMTKNTTSFSSCVERKIGALHLSSKVTMPSSFWCAFAITLNAFITNVSVSLFYLMLLYRFEKKTALWKTITWNLHSSRLSTPSL